MSNEVLLLIPRWDDLGRMPQRYDTNKRAHEHRDDGHGDVVWRLFCASLCVHESVHGYVHITYCSRLRLNHLLKSRCTL